MSRLLAASLALIALACGTKKPEENKNTGEAKGLVTNPPTEKSSETAAPAAPGSALDVVPDTAAMVFSFPRPEKSLGQVKSFMDRLGTAEMQAEFSKGLEKFKADSGLDLFDPELFKKIGLDSSKGVVFVADASLPVAVPRFQEYSSIIENDRAPLMYFVAAGTDDKTFLTWIKEADAKSGGKSRFEDATVADAKGAYIYAPSSSNPGKDALRGALLYKGGYWMLFITDKEAAKLDIAEAKDPIAGFQETLKGHLAKTAPLSKSANFTSAIKGADLNGDFVFYTDIAKLSDAMMLDIPDVTTVPTQDAAKVASQTSEMATVEFRKTSAKSEAENVKLAAGYVPAIAFSMALEKDKFAIKGGASAASATAEKIAKVFVPASTTPAYATLLPENTALFYRYSFSPSGFLEVLSELIPAAEKPNFEKGLAEASTALSAETGLDLSKDLIGGLTGHFAFAAPSPESIAMPAMAAAMGGMGGKIALPPMFIIAQVSSPDAGDKLLTALDAGLKKSGLPFPIKTEEVAGEKLYTLDAAGIVSISWGRTADLLVISTDAAALKEFYGKTKTPGASFADKLSSPLAKELVTSKAASGVTFDAGGIFTVLTTIPTGSPSDKEIFTKLAALFGTVTMLSEFRDGTLVFSGEALLK
jgi:hypothetical protein